MDSSACSDFICIPRPLGIQAGLETMFTGCSRNHSGENVNLGVGFAVGLGVGLAVGLGVGLGVGGGPLLTRARSKS